MATSLDVIRLDLPCQMPWDQMRGDERVRFCTQCNLNVHNLSAMSEAEAAAFVAMRAGRVCVAYERRPDGVAVFAGDDSRNSPGIVPYASPSTRRRRWLVPAAIAGAVVTAGATTALKPTVTQVVNGRGAGGGTMVAGGIGPAPLVAFDPRNPSPVCSTAVTVADVVRYDEFAKALQAALPSGLRLVDARYSVYPVGGPAAYGQAYVVAATAEADPSSLPASQTVVWLMPTGTTFPSRAGSVAPTAHSTEWFGGRDLFVESDDEELSNLIARGLEGPPRRPAASEETAAAD